MSDTTSSEEFKVSSAKCEGVQSGVLPARKISKTQSLSIRWSILDSKNRKIKEQLEKTARDVGKFREAADTFEQRLQAATERERRARRYYQQHAQSEPLRRAMHALYKMKREFKALRYRARVSFYELQCRFMEQEKRVALLESETHQELE